MSDDILFVDDEPNVLDAYRRQLQGKYSVTFAEGGEQGLAAIESHGAFAVVVSDMLMDGMNGVEFLKRVQQKTPDSVRLMLTGSNIESAIQAVNEGRIFRFLTKPCPSETLLMALDAALAQYQLVMSERTLLSSTLVGAVKILVDTLAAVRPVAFGRATRVRDIVRKLSDELELAQKWQAEVAALLSQVGTVFIPEETLRKAYSGQALDKREINAFQTQAAAGGNLVAHVPRMRDVATIIANQDKCYDGTGLPDNGLTGEQIPLEARILKVALDYDALLWSGVGSSDALTRMYGSQGKYDKRVLDSLTKSLAREAARALMAVAGA